MPRKTFSQESDSESDFETELGSLRDKPKEKKRDDLSDEELEESDGSVSEGGDLIEDSDDDAPESVSFTSGRHSALTAMKSAMEQIKKDKDSTKDRRRKQDEQNKKQKEEKLASLAKRKLPEDLLAAVSASRPKMAVETKRKKRDKKHVEVASEPDTKPELDFAPEHDADGHGFEKGADFIPLGKSVQGFQVVAVKEVSKVKTMSEDALNFRQNKLFGSSVPRESVKATMSKRTKMRVHAERSKRRR